MKTFGLIGRNLSHSFSASYFSKKFTTLGIDDCEYKNFAIPEIQDIKGVLKTHHVKGLNVTIPYKTVVIPFLDELSTTAQAVGAVNTICIKNGKTIGHNTDVYGFAQSIKPFLESQHEIALILGTGGASKAVEYALKQLGIRVYFASNSKQGEHYFSYESLTTEMLQHFKLIINCTPLGTFPKIEEKPKLPYDGIEPSHLLYDLVYNPHQTAFLNEGKLRNAAICNGLSMLQLQAEKSWELWNDQ